MPARRQSAQHRPAGHRLWCDFIDRYDAPGTCSIRFRLRWICRRYARPCKAHIVNSKSARFEPEKFEDHYEAALIDLINKKRAGQPLTAKARPTAGNVVNLMDALRASLGIRKQSTTPAKKPKRASGQKEMLLPIEGKKSAKEGVAKKTASKPQRRSA